MAYGARLESVLGESPRGFESPILRHHEHRTFPEERQVLSATREPSDLHFESGIDPDSSALPSGILPTAEN